METTPHTLREEETAPTPLAAQPSRVMGSLVRGKRPKLSDVIVDEVKRWIVLEGKKPGDRLPNEKELMALFGYSKSTVREALKALEVRGLISVRTGPAGGAYLQAMSLEHAMEPLRNFFHFQPLDSNHMYQLRKALEPDLAASVVGRLSEQQLQALEDNIRQCSALQGSAQDLRTQRVLEIEFHDILARSCPNPLLAFMCQFLNDLVRDFVVYKINDDQTLQSFGVVNVDFHSRLLDAFRRQDTSAVHALMHTHMCDAEKHMQMAEGTLGLKKLLMPLEPR